MDQKTRSFILDFSQCQTWGEIYREINEMQKCSETLSSITPELFNDFEMKIYCGIKERMEKGDNKVFRIE